MTRQKCSSLLFSLIGLLFMPARELIKNGRLPRFKLWRTFPVNLRNRFLIARSLRAHRARLHGPTSENNNCLSRLFAAAPAISAPILLLTGDPLTTSTSVGSTVSAPVGFSFAAFAHASCTSLVSRGPASEEEIPIRENTLPGVKRFKWDPGSTPTNPRQQKNCIVPKRVMYCTDT